MSDETVKIDSRDITLVVVAFLALAGAIGLLVLNLIVLSRQAKQAEQTHRAACSYRANLVQQAKSSEKYLAEHPNGVPSLGITAGQLRQSILRLQSASGSLSDLRCP